MPIRSLICANYEWTADSLRKSSALREAIINVEPA